MKYLNNIKTFDDFKPIVIKEDKYWNPNGTRRITLKLIDEMVEYIKIIYKPDNIEDIKNNFLSYITTKRGYIFVDENNFEELMEDYNNLIEDLEKKKKEEDEKEGNPHEDHILNTNVKIIVYQRHNEPNEKPKGVKNYFFKDNYCYYTIKKMNIFLCDHINKYNNKKTFDDDNNFMDLIHILSIDEQFVEFIEIKPIHYINCIYVYDAFTDNNNIPSKYDENDSLINSDSDKIIIKNKKKHIKNIIEKDFFNSILVSSVFSKYVSSIINKKAKSFNELFTENLIKYVKDNYKVNSCFINAIIQNYKNSFDVLKSDGKRKFKELTYSRLLSILDIDTNKNDNIGLSIKRAVMNFFIPFNLSLEVYNLNQKLIFKYHSNKPNQTIMKHLMRVMIDNNNHMILLNDNIKSLDQTKNTDVYTLDNIEDITDVNNNLFENIKVSNKFYIKNKNKLDDDDNNLIEDLNISYDDDNDSNNDIVINKYYLIKNINDITKIILDISNSETKNNNCILIYNENMDNLLIKICDSYIPLVNYENKSIKSIKIKIGEDKDNNIITISRLSVKSSNDSDIYINNIETIINFYNNFEFFYNKIINKNNISYFNKNSLEIENYYSNTAICGFFGEKLPRNNNYYAIDQNKAYTYCLSKIRQIPIFNYFDNWHKYNNQEIKPFNKYIVKCLTNDNISSMIFRNNYNKVYGTLLNQLPKYVKYEIIYYIEPSNIVNVNFENHIKELYNNSIDNDKEYDMKLKKIIINVLTGILERKYNRKSITNIFNNYNDAKEFADLYNVTVRIINNKSEKQIYDNAQLEMDLYEELKALNNNNKITITRNTSKAAKEKHPNVLSKDEIDEINKYNELQIIDNEKQVIDNDEPEKFLYLVVIENEELLVTNFKPIKDLIYNLSYIEIIKMYESLEKINIKPLGVNTDSILFDSNNLNDNDMLNIEKTFNFNNTIGGYKLEFNKKLVKVPLNYTIENDLLDLNENKVINHKINNEYDINEFNNIFKDNNLFMSASYPGCGKSQMFKNIISKFEIKGLIITKFTNLAEEIIIEGFEAITFNKLLGIHAEEDKKIDKFDVSDYDVIIFDEFNMYNVKELTLIHNYMLKNNNIRFGATGDSNQIESFGYNLNNIDNMENYIERCIDIIFPNQINLEIIKRLDSEEDKQKIINLKKDIFDVDNNPDVIELLKKYLKPEQFIYKMDELSTKFNICYFNYKADKINKHINKLIKKPEQTYIFKNHTINKKTNEKIYNENDVTIFYKDLEIIGKKYDVLKAELKADINIDHLKDSEYHFVKRMKIGINHTYKILAINDKYIVIGHMRKKEMITIQFDKLKFFLLPYAHTLFSVQGLSKSGKMTIFNADINHISRRFVWTSLTRARKLDDIIIKVTSKKELDILNISLMKRYLKEKVSNYMSQDKINNFEIDKNNYIDVNWFMKKLPNLFTKSSLGNCSSCGIPYELYIKNSKVYSNITADRINNNIGHSIDNCTLLCKDCNCAKSNN